MGAQRALKTSVARSKNRFLQRGFIDLFLRDTKRITHALRLSIHRGRYGDDLTFNELNGLDLKCGLKRNIEILIQSLFVNRHCA